jgi:hypothetical protein
MTSEELTSLLDRCRHRVTRMVLTGSALLGVGATVGLMALWAEGEGYLAPSGFVRVIGVFAIAGILVPAWFIWAVYRAQGECGGLCPNCHAWLIRQDKSLLSSGRCVKCGVAIATS